MLIEIQSKNIKDHQDSYDTNLTKYTYEKRKHNVDSFRHSKAVTCNQPRGTCFVKASHISGLEEKQKESTRKAVVFKIC